MRPKRKELELYLKGNKFDIVALNETLLKKIDFKVQGYETIKNDCSAGARVGVAFLLKHGLVVTKEYRNINFNIITDDQTLVIDNDLSNNQTSFWPPFTVQMEMRTLGCLKPLTTFPTVSCLSDTSILSLKLLDVPTKTTLVQMLKNI